LIACDSSATDRGIAGMATANVVSIYPTMIGAPGGR
jgi:hypothetical protein